MGRPGSLNMAELRRAARRIETVVQMAERIDRLEAALAAMGERLQWLEASANRARKDPRDGEGEYEISSLIG